MTQIITLAQNTSELDIRRCSVFSQFLERISTVEGKPTSAKVHVEVSPISALKLLAEKERLSFTETGESIKVLYTPSRESCLHVLNASSPKGWPSKIQTEHTQSFKAVEGALFRCPLEGDQGDIQIFITDWSPCPAACAIAVHPAHPVASSGAERTDDYFTGKFARHPLTGDLLPVWVASWVKQEFGTGAVLVNPAHDRVDLAFARRVGLQIRFALVPVEYIDKIGTWPTPPVIKTGITTKTGRFDGLNPHQAQDKYFEVLESNGLAERYTHLDAQSLGIADFVEVSPGDTLLCTTCGNLENIPESATELSCPSCQNKALIGKLNVGRTLQTLLSIDQNVAPVLVYPSAEAKSTLLLSRLLFFDLTGEPLMPAEVHSIQKTQTTKASNKSDVNLNLSLLVGAPTHQIVNLKQQIVEQTARFHRVHNELLNHVEISRELPNELTGKCWEAARKIKNAILNKYPARIFTLLYAFQKRLSNLSPEAAAGDGIFAGYFVLAYILAGYELPSQIESSEVWNRL